MSPARKRNPRAHELSIIHRGAAEVGFRTGKDDPRRGDWEDWLFTQARVRSAADLDEPGRHAVIQSLKRLGANVWIPAAQSAKPKPGTNRFGMPLNMPPEKAPMIRKINAILADNKLHWNYIAPMVRNLGADDVRFLSPDQLHDLIGMLMSQLPAKGARE